MLADWCEIAPAAEPGARNVRLANSEHPLDFRIGRDFRSRPVFQFEGDGTSADGIPVPKLSGMECELEPVQGGKLRLTLTLASEPDFPNFRLMCTGLMLATERFTPASSTAALVQVVDELHRWQEMLRHRRERLLSRNEIIGLVGELLFLRDVLCVRFGTFPALRCWNGPEGHEQDFVVGASIFEVKTQVVTSDRRIRISSEDQLDPVQGRIFICNQGIAPVPATNAGSLTLNALAAEIAGAAAAHGAQATDLLDVALLKARYEPREEYDDEAWVLVDRNLFAVTGDFPRIERAELRPGVEMVKYSIRVSDCQAYAVSLDETLAEAAA